MYNITLISTVHKEIGKCNADELCLIIEKINPEIIFLEALSDTYSNYNKMVFHSFGVYHERLEIKAMQKLSENSSFEYVPVLDNGLSGAFKRKYTIVCQHQELQKLIDNFNSLAKEYGFQFLNSVESLKLQEEMRILENRILNDTDAGKAADECIDTYENSMIRNIYSYCKDNKFNTAIFMCGVAHRKSIIKKIEEMEAQEKTDVRWVIFQN